MTLKAKSILISILTLVTILLSLKLFADYNALNNTIISNLLATDRILYAERRIYKLLTGDRPDIESAKMTVETMPKIAASLEAGDLTLEELHDFVSVKMSFIRIGRILKKKSALTSISGPELRQIQNELEKIELATVKFREEFGRRIEWERTIKKNIVMILYFSGAMGIVLALIGFYRYFIGPILAMSSQIKAVKDGKMENISIYEGKDEIGKLSDFTHQTLNELYKSSEALSQRLEIQYAISEVLKASLEAGDIDSFLKKALDAILSLKWLGIMVRGGIFLVDEADPGRLLLRAEKNFLESQKMSCSVVSSGECVCGRAAQTGEIVNEPSFKTHTKHFYEGMTPHGHYCVPIKHEQNVLGVISLYLEEGHKLNETEKEFIDAISLIVTESLVIKKHAEQEHLVTSAVEESGEGVMIADRKGAIEYVNPVMERITGYAKNELIGSNLAEHMGTDGNAGQGLDEVFTGSLWTGVVKNRKKDGAEYHEYVTIIPIKNENDEIVKFVSIRRDITKERRLEDQLAQAQKMELIGQLAGGIAHDFNNYMTAILGYSGVVMKHLKEDSQARKGMETMINAAKMAANLTRQLLTFSRKQVIRPEVMNLNSVIAEMGKMLRRIIGEDIELDVIEGQGLWNVKIDAGQIEQVLMNLAVNANDAMPEGGKMTIETANAAFDKAYVEGHIDALPGEYVMISVSDTGHGMTDEIKMHIFEPFFTTKEKGKGTGLGLAMVHGIVKQSDGHIYVYSEPGRGTTFKIYLPRVREQVEAKKLETYAEDKLRGSETILVVEDQDIVRQVAADVLSGLGYTVLEAKDGSDALDMCGRYHGRINLLLTDVIMPKMGGPELAAKIRERHPSIKVLYMSGYTDNAIAHHGILDKGVFLIHKPFTEMKLAQDVRNVLDL